MSKGSHKRGDRGKRGQRRAHNQSSRKPQYTLRFTEMGHDTLAEIFNQYRDRPLYYVLDAQGEPVPLGKSFMLTSEERARWQAFADDLAAWTLEETIVPNPEHLDYPVIVHTAFLARDISEPGEAHVLFKTSFMDKTATERLAAIKSEEEEGDDGSWLVEEIPPIPPEVTTLAIKLGLGDDPEAFDAWERLYCTRAEALAGHAETVRWVRLSLGVF